ncbi:MAG TPA: SDR family NAD(P)-dependent oxidoreductase, partial [Candidatus Acidoferrum sp.]|nr:SDR family NAD(P)-dependent oxidoreductase [Candidatus Acidoferrum sp.]
MGHPSLDLTGRTAVVVGGTSGIGLHIAKGLALAGANVVATGRRAELVRQIAAEIESLGRRSLPVACDVTSANSLEQLLAEVTAALGPV